MMRLALAMMVVALCHCATERTEYHYRPDYIAINQGRPLEETYVRPDGTKVVVTSKIPGSASTRVDQAVTPDATAPAENPSAPQKPTRAPILIPDLVMESFMGGLRNQAYGEIYDVVLSAPQRERMKSTGGREAFVKYCEANRRELMASSLYITSAMRSATMKVTQVNPEMTRYQLPDSDRGKFGFTIVEIERTPEELRLAGIR